SSDKTVRGWGCGALSALDAYDKESLETIAARLKDDDMWVRLNAAGALATFGSRARSALDLLREAAKRDGEGRDKGYERSLAGRIPRHFDTPTTGRACDWEQNDRETADDADTRG